MAVFDDASAEDTWVTFLGAGTYVLRLTSDDGELIASDEVTIVVNLEASNQAPIVNAGPDMTITLPEDSVFLDATVTDDGFRIRPER